ncbi:hypothetical protein WAK64_04315 [Bacillus spongiae]|uniref:Uncharacterized protein n=1 Tax=Bacillus spongiae TaxID=2683610 RepID=A0ABU8HAK6_9BACI
MIKKVGLFALAGAITFGGVSAGSAYANFDGEKEGFKQFLNEERFAEKWSQLSDEEKETKVKAKAEELGIEVEGKSIEELKELLNEQRQQRLFDRAEKAGIDTEGKTVDEVKALLKEQAPKHKGKKMNKEDFIAKWNEFSDEEKEAKIKERAEELGIDVEGKSTEEIRELVTAERQQRLFDRAEKEGVDTEGKTVEEVKELLKEAIKSSKES